MCRQRFVTFYDLPMATKWWRKLKLVFDIISQGNCWLSEIYSMRKQPTFREVATWALAERRLSNERRNSILMTCHYPDLGSASDWLCSERIFFQPIRTTTKIWVVNVISMKFLCSLLRHRFARVQVVTSRNIGCFLRLWNIKKQTI